MIGQLVNLLTGPVGPLLTIGGYQNLAVFISGVALVANIFVGVLLIPRLGVLGAACAASFATSLYLSLFMVAIRKIRVAPFDKRYVKLILAAGASLVSGMILKTLWNVGAAGLALQFGLVIAIFLTTLWVQGFEPEDRALLYAFKNPLMRMLGKGK